MQDRTREVFMGPVRIAPRRRGVPPSWAKVARAEPELAWMRQEARDVNGQAEWFCANAVWYRDFKPRLLTLVGWERRAGPEFLKTEDAYAVAYRTIYDELPDCRTCGCLPAPAP